ncbi:aromatic ring-hydroxylating oxygenase subunit alpha [Sulfuriferula nivalis]|uniref:(2Fe-2S)-binding protein n=1 Tax=Sulfuriferula nivalis TaxID=2675298 RepID=A0A809RJD0_9PROT|nr:aromatic ring-hydroxylating dioxygenase subunit alpha [Sulfuriferula nivalis]BBP00934.1 (2Fe-2S)-binding protein [Sulfuriferula nivalis]
MHDVVLWNDWHPLAASEQVVAGSVLAASLMGQEVALWRSADGSVHAWEDRCPHRGTRFSIGKVVADQLVCAYHGWRFDADGHCSTVPAQPDWTPSKSACARAYQVIERYGLVWVCLGTPALPLLPFPEYDDPHLRKVLCGPYVVATSAPRIVENFLDMGHFSFVHEGILGEAEHTAVRDYKVETYVDDGGETGVLATQCRFWQPQTNSLAHGGSEVEYTYRVVRPLTAILTKLLQAQQSFREAISLHVQPLAEEISQVWIVLAMTNFEQSDVELRAFQDRIFLQDKPILENQRPLRLPLAADSEVSIASDKLSVFYRRYLLQKNLHYGVITMESPL